MVRNSSSSQTSSALSPWLFNRSFEGSPLGLTTVGIFYSLTCTQASRTVVVLEKAGVWWGVRMLQVSKEHAKKAVLNGSVASILPEYKVCLLVAPAFVTVISSKIFLGCYSAWFYVTFHRKCCHLWQFWSLVLLKCFYIAQQTVILSCF